MRIVGGKFRGRTLASPKSQNIRPTMDRTRESLFNIIGHGWPQALSGSRVLDIFAGTGALGLEALSRGADFCLFVEQSTEGRALIRENVETLSLTGNTKIYRRDATRPGPVAPLAAFDLVFVDPPYGKELGQKALGEFLHNGWINENALIVLEEAKGCLPLAMTGFKKIDSRHFGDTEIGFYQVDHAV